jgi:hypothetical protein
MEAIFFTSISGAGIYFIPEAIIQKKGKVEKKVKIARFYIYITL